MASETDMAQTLIMAHNAAPRDPTLLCCINICSVPIDEANLLPMPKRATRFGTVSGMSDHTLGNIA